MSSRQLDDWIDSFLEFTDNSEPPESFRLWTAISCIAACLKRKCRLDWGTLTFYPNMYIVLVAPSGACRKGTAMTPGFNMLTDIGIKLAAEATTREALIRTLKKATDNTLNSYDGTMESHASLTIYSQELTVFLGYNNQQLMSDLTDWYDCRSRWHYSTKDERLADNIVNVWVNLFGATTPSLIQSTLPQDAIGGGLTSRIIFVYENKKGKRVAEPFLSERQVELYPKLIHDLEKIHMMSGKFKFTDGFLNRYVDWYNKSDDNRPFHDDRLAGYIERRPNHLLKLTMIMNASRSDDMILTELDFERARIILNETEKKMTQVFSGVGKNPLATVVRRALILIGTKGKMTYDELYNHLADDVDAYTFDKVLAALDMNENIQINRMGGKKTTTITFVDDEVTKQ